MYENRLTYALTVNLQIRLSNDALRTLGGGGANLGNLGRRFELPSSRRYAEAPASDQTSSMLLYADRS